MTNAENENVSQTPGASSGPDISGIVSRAKQVLTEPKDVWNSIKSEPATVRDLYVNYIAVLAAIPPICGFIGTVLFWGSPVVSSFISAVLSYALAIGLIYVYAFIVEKLTPNFGGQTDMVGALKLLGYSWTPVFVAGFLSLIPLLGILSIIFAVYAIYIYVQGITPILGVPAEKRGLFAVVSILCILVVGIVIGMIFGFLLLSMGLATGPM